MHAAGDQVGDGRGGALWLATGAEREPGLWDGVVRAEGGVEVIHILQGDCLDVMKTLPDASVQCCITSPPYWGLRRYLPTGHPAAALEIGQEKTPQQYVETMVKVFREVWRILKDDGTLWIVIGDSYASGKGTCHNPGGGEYSLGKDRKEAAAHPLNRGNKSTLSAVGLKPKDLVGIPWRVALALQADGWYLRSDIIWAKANCMPESVTDRPTRSHEYIFLLTKSERYYYNHEAIKEPCIYYVDGTGTAARKARASGNKLLPTGERNGIRPGGYKNSVNFEGKNSGNEKQRGHSRRHNGFNDRWDAMEKEEQCSGMRNKRDVWTVAPANYPEAHFATYPPALIKPCILAGCPVGGTVLDPFGGSGTTGAVANELGRSAILIELNPAYIPLIETRTNNTPGLAL